MHRKHDKVQELLENYREELMEPHSEWPPRIQRVVKCIHEYQFDQQLTVQWLKKKCHINGNNISGKFRYYVGKSPKKYWLSHRVAVAKQLLMNDSLNDVPIIDIALSVGFRSHSAFSMTFKNYQGTSPNDYRKRESK